MKIIDKINKEIENDNIFYSFEYFPPKTESGTQNLIERVERMNSLLNPLFVDITWGAGGRTSDSTMFLASFIQNYLHQDVLMHITCRCQKKDKLDLALEQAIQNNIKNLLILRGDPPQGMEDYDFSEDAFLYADEMVKYVREKYKDHFCIAVAGYPSTHIESKSIEDDLFYLKKKVDAGADFIVTQLFYDAEEFLEYRNRAIKYGIKIPILPGLLPVNNYQSFNKIINLCKISVPKELTDEILLIKHDEEQIKEFGIKTTISIINKLLQNGVKGFHFYTMNLEKSTVEIITRMNIKREQRIKELPWRGGRRSFTCSRSNSKENLSEEDTKYYKAETVRPIFWANNEKSYISKTFYWDEYPNGNWGDSRSPAFGNNEEHLHTFGEAYMKIDHNTKINNIKKNWGNQVLNYNDISLVFSNFLEGKIKNFPWGESNEIQEETFKIKDLLIKMNSKGLFTINSQPAVNGVESEDKVYGWGPTGGYIYQKMYVEFFIKKEILDLLVEKLNQNKFISFHAENLKGDIVSNLKEKDNTVCGLTWGVFPNREIIQPTIYDRNVFSIWKNEVFEKFDDWALGFEKKETENDVASYNFLKSVKSELYLITVFDNDYVKSKLEDILFEFISHTDTF